MKIMKRLFTGIQPTGDLHIGNYLGAIKQIVDLQHDYESFVMIADLHALTIPQDPKKYHDQVINVAATLVASGLDSQKTTLFVQSAIPAHAQLSWIFSTLTPLGELERMTQFKEKSDKHGQNAGLLTYPVLQAADILLYHADVVPVGEDQVQHLELMRTIARKFNTRYTHTFNEPKALLTHYARIMALNDPTKKMSKSIAGSAIALDASEDAIRSTIIGAVTDSAPDGAMSAGVANLFGLLKQFAPETVDRFTKEHDAGTIRYSDLKSALCDGVIATLTPIQTKKKECIDDPQTLTSIIKKGNQIALGIASQTIQDVYAKVGL